MSEQEEKNMALWNRHFKTDERHTRRINVRGGFTAVDAQYQLMCATREWGPYGSTWGVRRCKYEIVEAGGKPIEIYLEAEFFYPGGAFEIATDTKYPATDCRKKLLTDLTTKALSKLGFNADVFLGRFDGNKYVWTEDGDYITDPPEKTNGRAVPERGAVSKPSPSGLAEKKNALIAQVSEWASVDAKKAVGIIKEIIDALGLKNGGALDEKRVDVVFEWVKMQQAAERALPDAMEGEKAK